MVCIYIYGHELYLFILANVQHSYYYIYTHYIYAVCILFRRMQNGHLRDTAVLGAHFRNAPQHSTGQLLSKTERKSYRDKDFSMTHIHARERTFTTTDLRM